MYSCLSKYSKRSSRAIIIIVVIILFNPNIICSDIIILFEGKILSSDDYCVVYQACAFGIVDKNVSTTVAVKAFKHITNTDLRLTKALISELRTICEVGSHLNIVDFFGMYYRRKTVGNIQFFFNVFYSKPSFYRTYISRPVGDR